MLIRSMNLLWHTPSPQSSPPPPDSGILRFSSSSSAMADVEVDAASGQPKRRTFRKFSFHGIDLDALLDMKNEVHARARRRFQRGLKRKPLALIKKLCKAKQEAPQGEGV